MEGSLVSRAPRHAPRNQDPTHEANGTMASLEEVGASKRGKHYRWHEAFNLLSLPFVLFLCTAGAAGAMDGWYYCLALFLHVLFDTVWITWKPEALPRWAAIIQLHHIITLSLLLHPLRHPEHAIYACYEGLCEYNTFFLVARRQFKRASKIMNLFFWITFVPTRILVFPCVLWMCPRLMEGHNIAEKINVYCCQAGLLLFNCVYLYTILPFAKKKSR